MKEYFVVNIMNGSVQVFISKSRYKALERARAWFGTNKLEIYTR